MAHAFIPAPNTARVEMVYNYADSMVENVFHCSKGSPFTHAQLVSLVGVFASQESTSLKTFRNIDVTLDHIKATALDTNSSPFYQETEGIIGTRGGEPMPPSVTFAVKQDTGLTGRSFRGRTYWVGISGDMLSSNPNTLLTAAATGIVAVLNGLLLALQTATTPLCVTSYRNNNAWRTTAVSTPVLQFVGTDMFVDNQRRRLLGHNRHR